MKKNFPVCLLFCWLLGTFGYAQEEWLLDDFHTSYLTVGYHNYNTSHFWNKQGKKKAAFNRFHQHQFVFYGQYGITCTDTIGIRGGYTRVNESMNGRTMGWQDFEIDWKHLLWHRCGRDSQQLYMQLIGIVPAKTSFLPTIRYGRFGVEADLGYRQRVFVGTQSGWYEVQAGYRWYQKFPSDQVRAHFKLGWRPWCMIDIVASGFLEYGVFNGHPKINQSLVAFAPNYRLFTMQLEGVWYFLKRFAVSCGYMWHVWGENVGTGGGAFVEGSYKF